MALPGGVVKVLDANDEVVFERDDLFQGKVSCVAFSQLGHILAIGGTDGWAYIVRVEDWKVRDIGCPDNTSSVVEFLFTKDEPEVGFRNEKGWVFIRNIVTNKVRMYCPPSGAVVEHNPLHCRPALRDPHGIGGGKP